MKTTIVLILSIYVAIISLSGSESAFEPETVVALIDYIYSVLTQLDKDPQGSILTQQD